MIKVSMKGAGTLSKALQDLQKANRSANREFLLIGRRMLKQQRDHFTDQKDAQGTTWPPLSEATIAARRKGSSVPLRDTGRLFTSLASKSTSLEAAVGTNVLYAATHQFGDDDRGIPARQFLYITDEEKNELVQMITDPLILIHLEKHGNRDVIGDTPDVEVG